MKCGLLDKPIRLVLLACMAAWGGTQSFAVRPAVASDRKPKSGTAVGSSSRVPAQTKKHVRPPASQPNLDEWGPGVRDAKELAKKIHAFLASHKEEDWQTASVVSVLNPWVRATAGRPFQYWRVCSRSDAAQSFDLDATLGPSTTSQHGSRRVISTACRGRPAISLSCCSSWFANRSHGLGGQSGR